MIEKKNWVFTFLLNNILYYVEYLRIAVGIVSQMVLWVVTSIYCFANINATCQVITTANLLTGRSPVQRSKLISLWMRDCSEHYPLEIQLLPP